MSWERAGHHWGKRAWDWAIYQEPIADNLYDATLTALDVRAGVRLVDIGCGSGIAVQRAVARGAEATGVDASQGLLDIAAQRADATWVLAGMTEIPLPDESFDAVTSFNGLQFGGPGAVAEAARLLRAGGRIGVGFWSDLGEYGRLFGAVASLAPPPDPNAPSPMGFAVPGVAEDALASAGLAVLSRATVQVIGLYRNASEAARGFGSSGPASIAVEHSGEQAVSDAIRSVVESHADPDTGVVRLVGSMDYVIAHKP